MNKTFKTVWNRVRRAYVAVNETVSSTAQSSGSTIRKGSISVDQSAPTLLRRTMLSLAVGAALSMSLGSANAAINMTVNAGQSQTLTNHAIVADQGETGYILNNGTLNIIGSATTTRYGLRGNARNGGTGTIENAGVGTLLISGGASEYMSFGMEYNASGSV